MPLGAASYYATLGDAFAAGYAFLKEPQTGTTLTTSKDVSAGSVIDVRAADAGIDLEDQFMKSLGHRTGLL